MSDEMGIDFNPASRLLFSQIQRSNAVLEQNQDCQIICYACEEIQSMSEVLNIVFQEDKNA